MSLIPWREKHPISELRSEIDNIFDQFFNKFKGADVGPWEGGSLRAPVLDMEETDKYIIIKAEMPGIDPKDFQLSLTGKTLTIKAENKEDKEEKKKNYHLIERRYGSFYRSVPLPCDIETDRIEANYAKGILEIKMPKCKPTEAKKIEVNIK